MVQSLRRLLYTPSGRAGEYANKGYAANLYKGCTHACKYCYVPRFLKMNPEQKQVFHSIVTPAPDLIRRVERDVKRLGKMPEPIFLCFTCDPYPQGPALNEYTSLAIKVIMASGNSVNILTKAGRRGTHDLRTLADNRNNRIGATLTFFDEQLSKEWEPGAASPERRLEMLRAAKWYGVSTWASIEPVIIPEQSLAIMEAAARWVDEFKIGKWNHDKAASNIDWSRFAHDAIALMKKLGKRYFIKAELAKYLS